MILITKSDQFNIHNYFWTLQTNKLVNFTNKTISISFIKKIWN